MMDYLVLIKPELVLGMALLIIGFICLGAYATHVDKKREKQKNKHSH